MNIFIFENNWQAIAAELDDESLDMFLANCVARQDATEEHYGYAVAAQWLAAEWFRRHGEPFPSECAIWNILAEVDKRGITAKKTTPIDVRDGDRIYFLRSQMQCYWDSLAECPQWTNRRPPDWYDGGGWGL